MLSDDEMNENGEFSEDEVMDSIMQKQAQLCAIEDRNRTTYEILIERMKESMERQEILKRVTLANNKVRCYLFHCYDGELTTSPQTPKIAEI